MALVRRWRRSCGFGLVFALDQLEWLESMEIGHPANFLGTFEHDDVGFLRFPSLLARQTTVIEHDSDPDVKFEVFERLNLGAEKLNDQELRNSVYRGRYNDLLRDLATNPHMLKIMGTNRPHNRMLDRQTTRKLITSSTTGAAARQLNPMHGSRIGTATGRGAGESWRRRRDEHLKSSRCVGRTGKPAGP